MAKLSLDRTLSAGRIRVSIESMDIPAHSALGPVAGDTGLNLAMVNVLDIAEELIHRSKAHTVPPVNAVGGACGEDSERISDR